jgi:hypothetical protein
MGITAASAEEEKTGCVFTGWQAANNVKVRAMVRKERTFMMIAPFIASIIPEISSPKTIVL